MNRSWRRGRSAVVWPIVLCAAANAAQRPDDKSIALEIIPTPQQLSWQGGMLPLVTKDRSASVVTPGYDLLESSRWHRMEFDWTEDVELNAMDIDIVRAGTE